MNRRHLRTSKERGSTLIGVTILALVMLLSALAVMQIGSQDAALAMRDERVSDAFYLAEAGVQHSIAWLKAQGVFPSFDTYPLGESPLELGCGSYLVSIRPDSVHSTATRPAYTITSVGYAGGRQRRLEVDVGPQSFADFLYFTNMEHEPSTGGPCWFTSADVLDGPLHTNDQIHIFGDPVFKGDVESGYGGPDDSNLTHNPAFLYYNGSSTNHLESTAPSNAPHDVPTFEDGYELGVSTIEIPDVLRELQDLAEAGGVVLITLAGNYEIVMSRPDSAGIPMYGYVSYRRSPVHDWVDVDLSSINGMIYVTGGAEVSGVLDGRLTIACSSNLYVVDDITYRESDENGPTEGCDDVLGLVAAGDIVVENNEANQTDCVIHGAMMALNQSFRVDGYNVGDPRGDLTIYGGLVQEFRGPVGTVVLTGEGSEVQVVTGYRKDYHYDYRLRDLPPPGFFQTGTYKRLAWRDCGDS
jgi:hypothetical protein